MHNVLIWSQSWKVIKLWINYNIKISLGKWHRKNKQKLSNAHKIRCLRLKVSFFSHSTINQQSGLQSSWVKDLDDHVSSVWCLQLFTVCPVDRSVNSDTGALARWTNTCYLWMNDLNNKLLITRRPLHFNSLPNIWSMKTISRSKDLIYGVAFNRSINLHNIKKITSKLFLLTPGCTCYHYGLNFDCGIWKMVSIMYC